MKKQLILIFFMVSQFCFGDVGTVYGPPAGYCKVNIAGRGSSVIGAPLLRDAVAAGRITASSSNQITVSDVTWTDHQFAPTSQPYYLEVVSGNLAGCFFSIIDNTSNTLILQTSDLTNHPLGALVADTFTNSGSMTTLTVSRIDGDLVRIRQTWTIGSLFGASGSNTVLNPVVAGTGVENAETLSIPDNENLGIRKPPLLSVINVSGSGWLDRSGTDYTNLALLPGTALITHRFGNLVGQTLVVIGNVPPPLIVSGSQCAPCTVYIPGVPSLPYATSGTGVLANEVYIAPIIGDPINVGGLGLIGGNGGGTFAYLASSTPLNRGDELVSFTAGDTGVFNPDVDRLIYYSGSTSQWQEMGVSGSTSLQLEPGNGYLLRIKPGNPGGYWKQIPNY